MAGRPGTLPWNFATFTGTEPVTTMSDNYNALLTLINDSGNGFVNYGGDTGAVNAYVITIASAPTAYTTGMTVVFVPANTNSGASTINVNSLGNVSITTKGGLALSGTELSANKLCAMVYDGTKFRIITINNLYKFLSPQVGDAMIDCAGYDTVMVIVAWNSATSTRVTLNHLAQGTNVSITYRNSSGVSNAYAISANDTQAVNFAEVLVAFPSSLTGSAAIDMTVGGSLSSGNSITFTGIAGFQRIDFSV